MNESKPEILRLTLALLRRASRDLLEHGSLGGYIKVTIPADCESDARDLPGFTPVEALNTVVRLVERLGLPNADVIRKPLYEHEVGRVERFVLVLSRQKQMTVEAGDQTLSFAIEATPL